MVQIESLTKQFEGRTVLQNLNLNIQKGSIYGLIGVNGAGKTTAIKHLAGIYRQDSGRVCISGLPVYDNTALKARVGYIPDDLYFFPGYNMKRLRNFYKRMYPNWNDERYQRLHTLFNLNEKHRVDRFSKGMQKQAAFVFVMSIMPDLLLLDEPIDGLDPMVRKTVFGEIFDDVAERELTVLVSSHNLKELDGICDSIGIIKNGHMAIERDLDSLKAEVHKIQVAFSSGTQDSTLLQRNYEGLNILHQEQRGNIDILVVRGEEAVERIKAMNPLLFDRLPLTLEEVFLYEGSN